MPDVFPLFRLKLSTEHCFLKRTGLLEEKSATPFMNSVSSFHVNQYTNNDFEMKCEIDTMEANIAIYLSLKY